jgi:hypothetical protein
MKITRVRDLRERVRRRKVNIVMSPSNKKAVASLLCEHQKWQSSSHRENDF